MASIRTALMDDLDALEELESISFPDAWSRGALERALREIGYLVLIAGQPAHGFLLGWNIGCEAEIARLGVAPEHRGQGSGLSLVEYAKTEFKTRGVTALFLEVREENEPARRLYRRAGFEEVGRRKAYYASGEDAIVMKTQV